MNYNQNFDDELEFESNTWKFVDKNGNTKSTKIKTDQDVGIGTTTSSSSYDLDVDGSLTVDEEKIEEVRELQKNQSEKVKRLRDHIIDYLAENEVSGSGLNQWKRDLEAIDDYREQLYIDSDNYFITFPNTLNEDNVLGPDDLEKLNEIYDRWS